MKDIFGPKGLIAALAVVAVLVASAGTSLCADEQKPQPAPEKAVQVTLKDSISDLLRTHERIKSAEAAVVSAEHSVGSAKGGWWPKVEGEFSHGKQVYEKNGVSPTGGAIKTNYNNTSLIATQNIFNRRLSGDIEVAKGQHKVNLAKLEQVRQEIAMQGVSAFLGIIRSREMLRYAVLSEENIMRLSGMQEALVERGVGLSYEELQIKAQLAAAQSHKVTVERGFINARNKFKSVFGVDLTEAQIASLVLPGLPAKSLPESLDAAVGKSLATNPVIVELTSSLELREGELTKRQANMYPRLQAKAAMSRAQDKQSPGSTIDTDKSLGLVLSYSLFDGFSDIENIRAGKQDILSVRKALQDRNRTVEENVRNAWNEMMTLRKNILLYENQGNITWTYLELIKRKKSMGGEVNLLDILVGERDYISATSSKVGAEIELITSGYTVLYQMGLISPDVVED